MSTTSDILAAVATGAVLGIACCGLTVLFAEALRLLGRWLASGEDPSKGRD